jgi:hypothetical protein
VCFFKNHNACGFGCFIFWKAHWSAFLKKTFVVIPSGYQTLDMLGIVGIKRVDDNYYVAKCPWTYWGFIRKIGTPSWLLPWGPLFFVKPHQSFIFYDFVKLQKFFLNFWVQWGKILKFNTHGVLCICNIIHYSYT